MTNDSTRYSRRIIEIFIEVSPFIPAISNDKRTREKDNHGYSYVTQLRRLRLFPLLIPSFIVPIRYLESQTQVTTYYSNNTRFDGYIGREMQVVPAGRTLFVCTQRGSTPFATIDSSKRKASKGFSEISGRLVRSEMNHVIFRKNRFVPSNRSIEAAFLRPQIHRGS